MVVAEDKRESLIEADWTRRELTMTKNELSRTKQTLDDLQKQNRHLLVLHEKLAGFYICFLCLFSILL